MPSSMPALWMGVAAATATPVAGAGVIGILCCAGTGGALGGRGAGLLTSPPS